VLPPPPPIASNVTSRSSWAVTASPVEPFDSIVAFVPIFASTRAVRTSVELETPTPADEPKASPPAYTPRSASSEADTVRFPPARTVALSPIEDSAVWLPPSPSSTKTMIEAEIPALVEAPTETANAVRSSDEIVSIVMFFAAFTLALAPIDARTSLSRTMTRMPAPMPTEPVEAPRPPAPSSISVVSVARTVMLWFTPGVADWLTCALPPIEAVVRSVMISTTTEPPIATSPFDSAPPAANVMPLMSPTSGSVTATALPMEEVASTVICSVALTVALELIVALVVKVITLTATAAPTAVSPSAPESARFCSFAALEAATRMSPVEVRDALEPTVALFVITARLIPTEAETLTSLDCAPEAAKPHATKSFVAPAVVTASTVIPTPVTIAFAPTVARLSTCA
jgi:hypothetical protein